MPPLVVGESGQPQNVPILSLSVAVSPLFSFSRILLTLLYLTSIKLP